MDLTPRKISEGTLAFMFESGFQWTLTDYAMKRSGKLHEHEPRMWDDLKGQFVKHLDSVNRTLQDAGLPAMNNPRSSIKA